MSNPSVLPVGDSLEEPPEERLRDRPSVTLPTPAPSVGMDVLAPDAMDKNGLQGTAEGVSVTILTRNHCIEGHVSLLQGLQWLGQFLFDLHDSELHKELLSTSCMFFFDNRRNWGVVLKTFHPANYFTSITPNKCLWEGTHTAIQFTVLRNTEKSAAMLLWNSICLYP